MRLFEKYRPKRLADVVGQPPVQFLRGLVRNPYSCCILLDGPPGCGKTAAAYALAHELGCYDEETWPEENAPTGSIGCFTGLFTMIGSELSVDAARELIQSRVRLRYGSASGFCVVVIEELEWVSKQCQVFLKTALETRLPKNVIVIATTNDPSGLGAALLQRFKLYHFSGGPTFAEAANSKLRDIWDAETDGATAPASIEQWGWVGDSFSMRVALDNLQDHLAVYA